MRQFFGLLIGLAVGLVGATLFLKSQRPAEDSVEERLEQAEMELRRSERAIREMTAKGLRDGPRRKQSEGARRIMEDIKAGRDVDLDDVFLATKPWMQDLSPILNRIRLKEQQDQFDRRVAEWSREYDLTTGQQDALRRWLDDRAKENSDAFDQMINSPQSRLEDMVRFGRDAERNLGGVDDFMEQQLRGEALERYREDRLVDRIESVQDEANRKLNRLDTMVELDPAQEDELFYLMARGSDGYIPSLEIEGMTGTTSSLDRVARDEAIRSVLRPEQREAFDAERAAQREEANRELRELGMTLPADWDLFDYDDW